MDDIKTEATTSTAASTSTNDSKEKTDSKPPNNDVKVNTLDIPTKIETVKSGRRKLRLDISMKAVDVLHTCQAYAASAGKMTFENQTHLKLK